MRSSKLKTQGSRTEATSGNSAASEVIPEWVECDVERLILRESTQQNPTKPWNLEERCALFGESVLRFTKEVPRTPANDRLVGQLAGASTSVGANYCEASQSVSRKDFAFTISRCAKEAKEARFFLRMIVASEPKLASSARPLWREATELLRIFASMRVKPPRSGPLSPSL